VEPTIGLALRSLDAESAPNRRAAARYRSALEAFGAVVVELRPQPDPPTLDGLDGLLLSGGGDLHPRCYGDSCRAAPRSLDDARDAFELAAVRAAIERGLPLLGICRGAQVLGVALGGKLVQDIRSDVQNAQQHEGAKPGAEVRHWIDVEPLSRIGLLVGARRMRVNSSHHQANHALGAAVREVARSPDGVTEAIEWGGADFVVGVQWHPERMWRRAPRQRRLLAAFADVARARAAEKRR
jgi:putative glutamine amidotransferase